MTENHYDPNFILDNPWQTRSREPDQAYIEELAEDIKKNGLLQVPIGRIINHNGAGKVQLAFGHNRLRAFLHLKRPLMPVDVRVLNDEQMAAFAWSENEKRRDVTAVERALAIQKRIKDFGWTNRQAAEALGVDHSTISHILKLLILPEVLQNANLEGKLAERQLQAVLPLFDISDDIYELLEKHGYYVVNSNRASIIKSALDGASSDYLRQAVDLYLTRTTRDLAQAEFKISEKFQEGSLIYCGLCSACDRRIASRNRCADLDCYDAKTEAVHQLYLADASMELGYDLVDKDKGGSPTEIYSHEMEKLKALNCPNLRLTYYSGDLSEFPGYPHAHLVCDKRNNSCTCKKGLSIVHDQEWEASRHTSQEKTDEGTGEVMEAVEGEVLVVEGEGETELITPARPADNLALEEVVRQQKRSKNEAIKIFHDLQDQVTQLVLQALYETKPGAFYPLIRYAYRRPSTNELNLQVIFKAMAVQVADFILPEEYESKEDLLRSIDDRLGWLDLGKLADFQEGVPVKIDQPVDDIIFPVL